VGVESGGERRGRVGAAERAIGDQQRSVAGLRPQPAGELEGADSWNGRRRDDDLGTSRQGEVQRQRAVAGRPDAKVIRRQAVTQHLPLVVVTVDQETAEPRSRFAHEAERGRDRRSPLSP
jgi:hypothetical protein